MFGPRSVMKYLYQGSANLVPMFEPQLSGLNMPIELQSLRTQQVPYIQDGSSAKFQQLLQPTGWVVILQDGGSESDVRSYRQ